MTDTLARTWQEYAASAPDLTALPDAELLFWLDRAKRGELTDQFIQWHNDLVDETNRRGGYRAVEKRMGDQR